MLDDNSSILEADEGNIILFMETVNEFCEASRTRMNTHKKEVV